MSQLGRLRAAFPSMAAMSTEVRTPKAGEICIKTSMVGDFSF
jgi:hypothetical protein